jgi:hypothetical protein
MTDSIVDQGASMLRRFCFCRSSQASQNGFVGEFENFVQNPRRNRFTDARAGPAIYVRTIDRSRQAKRAIGSMEHHRREPGGLPSRSLAQTKAKARRLEQSRAIPPAVRARKPSETRSRFRMTHPPTSDARPN